MGEQAHQTAILLVEVGALLLGLSLLGRLGMRFGISPIPLYLLVGLAFGAGGWLPLSASAEFFEVGSEIGVILLLVMLGLEYSATELVGGLRNSKVAGILDFAFNAIPGAAFALILGWGPIAALALAGITWVSSSGVVAKLLRDLGRIGNRETPTILSILVIEDLAMAFYLPVLSAFVIGLGLIEGEITLAIAVLVVLLILLVALRWGRLLSKLFPAENAEPLLLGVLGLTMLVAGLADQVNVSAAVGAFLVGIALSGPVAHNAVQLLTPLRDLFATIFFVFFGLATDPAQIWPVLVPALLLALATVLTKTMSGYIAARRAGIGKLGRWRTGLALIPRGEFSIVIAGLAVGAGIQPALAPLATAYVLLTIVIGSIVSRFPEAEWFRRLVVRGSAREGQASQIPTSEPST
ncbi:CPA2 family monovalent cation:H+ antiporter-2 [Cryobacterium mesophilum]|uniref:Cation:proton antiporter n=1 Tax=Terrimesophilobacter mesophilus TaxID=433647 RepID=A0A4R8V8Y3_9MICO|nr:cation:proton antiporter [Terrimesophilobacter mesophilus]MBB5632806.1 CPA2 family monovalent cation:H+ antiporter-2 [Terrimesophilobacter mesophilus]TFB79594.1 cation:proton antiporter [Terrimesophilobacter mesophilus]